MIGAGILKKLVGGSVGLLAATAAAARHASWYVRYRAAGTARDEGEQPAGGRDEG